jgi:hypothetical protein
MVITHTINENTEIIIYVTDRLVIVLNDADTLVERIIIDLESLNAPPIEALLNALTNKGDD